MSKNTTKTAHSKSLIRNIIILAVLLVSPFVACGPRSIKKGTVYSKPLTYHVAYFVKESSDKIVFGEKELGQLGSFRISGFSLYDESGKEVGRITGGFNDANVTFYDDMFGGELNGRYTVDH